MPTSDGRVGHRDLCTAAVVERTIGPASVSSLKIAASLQSDNFSSGSAGWKIERDTGSAEFQDVTVRGKIVVSDGTGVVEIDDGNWAVDFASISLNRGFTNPGIIGVHGTNDQLEITAPWDTTVGDRAFIILGNDTATLPGRLLLQAGNSGELALQSGTQTTFFGGNVDFFGGWEVESSDGDITGSLIPSADITYDLGSTSQSWRALFVDDVFASFGAAASPSYTFEGDTNTGMYRISADQLGLVAGGSEGVRVSSSYLQTIVNVTGNPAIRLSTAGTATTPAYAFVGDLDTGMYRVGANQIGIVAGGTEGISISSSKLKTLATGTGGMSIVIDIVGTASNPVYSFEGDTDTGMYWVQAGVIGFTANTEVNFKVTTTGAQIPNHGTTADAANMTVLTGTNDEIRRSTASARRYKRNISDAPIDLTRFGELQARVFQYKRSHLASDDFYWGMVAEEVADVYPKMVDYQGELAENVRYANLVVVAIEKIKELEFRVVALEAA